jgi:MFS family permease
MSDIVRPMHAEGQGWILVVVAGGWLAIQGMRFVIPTLLPQITSAFEISNTAAGAAVTALWTVYAAMQFPVGLATDRIGERWMLVASMLVAGACAVAFALMPTYLVFVGACLLFGVGTGLYGPTRGTLLSAVFPDNDGTALGITWAAGSLGAAGLPFVAGVIAAAFGWRVGFAFGVPLFALLTVGNWWIVPDRYPGKESTSRDSKRKLIRRIIVGLARRRILLAGCAFTILAFVFQGLTAFLPTYLVVAKGLRQETAALAYGAFFAASALIQPVAGAVADQYGDRMTLAVVTAFSGLLLFALPFVTGVTMVALLVALLGFRGGVAPITNAYLVSSIPADVQGAGYGLLRTVYMGLGATAPVVVGFLADSALFDEAYLLLALLTGAATVLYLLLPRRSAAETP